jgi:hypothetical protein
MVGVIGDSIVDPSFRGSLQFTRLGHAALKNQPKNARLHGDVCRPMAVYL